jgi:hypothetical protein
VSTLLTSFYLCEFCKEGDFLMVRLNRLMSLMSQNRDNPEKLRVLARKDPGAYLYALNYLPRAVRVPAIEVLADGLETTVVFSRFSLEDGCEQDKVLTIDVAKKERVVR